MPIFYLVSMTWFDSVTHPISLLLYGAGIAGLGLMAFRRKREDMFLLLWFIVVYVVFTLIPNRDWRYITIAFPVLAIAASSILVVTFDKILKIGRQTRSLNRKWGTKIAATLLIAFVATGVLYSCTDAYNMEIQSQVQVPVDKATYYVAQSLGQNQSVVVACPLNRFNQYMVWFYLYLKNPNQNYSEIWQYPTQAVDAYIEDFNVSQFILLCQQNNAKYVMLYEFGDSQYFNSALTTLTICSMLNQTGQFTHAATFGNQPNRIFVFSFT
jgi:4-amino-4-deoxy-L-arabinose transferase-like glycosyltransferase